MQIVRAGESLETRDRERRIVNGRLTVSFEVADEPPGRDSRKPARVFERNQDRQLEQFPERWPAELAQRRFGNEQIAALDSAVVDSSRMTLRRQRPPSWGRTVDGA